MAAGLPLLSNNAAEINTVLKLLNEVTVNILITGANRGIGHALTLGYLMEGHHVLATFRERIHAAALLELQEHHADQLRLIELDVTSQKAPAVLADFAKVNTQEIDILLNNAGIFPRTEHIGTLDLAVIAQTFATNTIAPLLITQALLPRLFASRCPRVVNLTSDLALSDRSIGGSYY
ncbi:hypothetical protein CCP3SC15_510015 [Gammaproteobacteria bacterium]